MTANLRMSEIGLPATACLAFHCPQPRQIALAYRLFPLAYRLPPAASPLQIRSEQPRETIPQLGGQRRLTELLQRDFLRVL